MSAIARQHIGLSEGVPEDPGPDTGQGHRRRGAHTWRPTAHPQRVAEIKRPFSELGPSATIDQCVGEKLPGTALRSGHSARRPHLATRQPGKYWPLDEVRLAIGAGLLAYNAKQGLDGPGFPAPEGCALSEVSATDDDDQMAR